jgi:hypothetical protein
MSQSVFPKSPRRAERFGSPKRRVDDVANEFIFTAEIIHPTLVDVGSESV